MVGTGGSRGLALRMATGTGKTAVMACLIAWYAVNRRREHRGDARGAGEERGRIVVICPGRTIRDRLLGLAPNTKGNIYDEWRLVPPRLRRRLGGFPVEIINWEKLQPRKGLSYAGIEVKSGTTGLSRGEGHSFSPAAKNRAKGPSRLKICGRGCLGQRVEDVRKGS